MAKKSEIMARIEKGERLIVCEYRSSKLETLNWRDKDTGKSMSAAVVRHTLESGPDSVTVNERTGNDFDAAKWVPPAKKGQMVALHFTEFKTERGIMSARGNLEVIE